MNILCISASNISVAKGHSASTRTCELVRDILAADGARANVEIAPLIDYELKPCRMCGQCFKTGRCANDPAFNMLHQKMVAADAIFLACPHYAPIPSKVMIVLEKLEEMLFLKSCADANYRSPLWHKPIALIAHGGQTAEALPYYKTALLDPLAGAFASVQMQVVGAGEGWPNGATFGIKSIALPAGSIFVTIEHDWDDIRQRITPLVRNVVAALPAAVTSPN
jgi:multimeric flavodoxin WrbA